MKYVNKILASFLLFPLILVAQPSPELDWIYVFDTQNFGEHYIKEVKTDAFNNIYLAGSKFGSENNIDLFISKYTRFGDSLFYIASTYGPNTRIWPNSIAIDTTENIYATGYKDTVQNGFNAFITKYSDNGELLWNKNIKNSRYGSAITLDINSNPLLGYNSDYSSFGSKYLSNGDSIWIQHLGDTSDVVNIVVDKLNCAYFTATHSNYGNPPDFDCELIKLSNTGEVLWSNVYEENGCGKMILDNDDNIIFIMGLYIAKIDSGGNVLWIINSEFSTYDITVDIENNILITGSNSINSERFYVTKKLSPSGDEIWTREFNSEYPYMRDYGISICNDDSNNVYVTGFSVRGDSSYSYTLKYSNTGELIWKYKLELANTIFMKNKIMLDDSNYIYIVGNISDQTYGYGFYIGKIDQSSLSNFNLTESSIPARYFLSQNYPNPFNPTTTIKYQIPELSFVIIKVYDVLGSEVATLVNEEKSVGSYEVEFYGTGIVSGIYFYRIQAGSFTETKKMVLMK